MYGGGPGSRCGGDAGLSNRACSVALMLMFARTAQKTTEGARTGSSLMLATVECAVVASVAQQSLGLPCAHVNCPSLQHAICCAGVAVPSTQAAQADPQKATRTNIATRALPKDRTTAIVEAE
jgi:hypothetical protein